MGLLILLVGSPIPAPGREPYPCLARMGGANARGDDFLGPPRPTLGRRGRSSKPV